MPASSRRFLRGARSKVLRKYPEVGGWCSKRGTRRAYINSRARRSMLALLRVSRGVYGDPPRPFSPSLRGIRCRSSSSNSNSNSSSFKHPLAKLLPAGHRQVVAGSRYRNCQLPITCNSWPASVSGRSLVLCYRINPPSVTTEPRNRAGSHGRNWTPYLLPRKRLPESESR